MPGKKTLLYITKEKILVSNSAKDKGKLYQIDWDGNDPTRAFKSIKKNLRAKSVVVILGNDLSYVLTVQVPQTKTNRAAVLSEVQPLIPENITEANFDWKTIGANTAKKLKLVQVVATSGNILNNLSYAAKANKMKIETINPVAVLLAGQTKLFKNPHLIVWSGHEKLAVVSHRGNVYLSENIERDPQSAINDLIEFTKEKHGLKISLVVFEEGVDKKIEFPAQWKVKKESLNPMVAAAAKKQEKGKEEEALELKPVDEPEKPEKKKEEVKEEKEGATGEEETAPTTEGAETPAKTETKPESTEAITDKESTKPAASTEDKEDSGDDDSDSDEEEDEEEEKPPVNKKIFIILAVVIVVGGLVVGGTLYFRSRVEKTPAASEETTEAAPTPTPEPEVVSLEDYKVQVLNGSGIAGEAGVVQNLLDSAGLEEIETGNADNYDYTDTKVGMKELVPDEVFDEVKKALGNYSVVKSDALSDDSGYDIVVTVGSTKSEEEATPTPES